MPHITDRCMPSVLSHGSVFQVTNLQKRDHSLTASEAFNSTPYLVDEFRWRCRFGCVAPAEESGCLQPIPLQVEGLLACLLEGKELESVVECVLVLLESGFVASAGLLDALLLASTSGPPLFPAIVRSKLGRLLWRVRERAGSHYLSWMLQDGLLKHQDGLQVSFTIGARYRRKSNFLLLLNLFLQNHDHSWLYFPLDDCIQSVVDRHFAWREGQTMTDRFETAFRLLGLDFFFSNPYDFVPLMRCLLEGVFSAQDPSPHGCMRVALLRRALDVVCSFAVHQGSSYLERLVAELVNQLRGHSNATVFGFLQSAMAEFPSVKMLVIFSLLSRHYQRSPEGGKAPAQSQLFSFDAVVNFYLRYELPERPGKTDGSAEESDLQFLIRLKRLILDAFLASRVVGEAVFLTRSEWDSIACSPFLVESPPDKRIARFCGQPAPQ